MRRYDARGADEVREVVRYVFSPDGHSVDPAQLAKVPTSLMSDVLVELMEPYIDWPPAKDEIADLEAWLKLGAQVWNATVEASNGTDCVHRLEALANGLATENAVPLMLEIARRRFARFPDDWRRVASVRVVAEDGRATVWATSFSFVPGDFS
ncbi:MAG: hypothetical protein V2A73_16435 [Pseudomonadota bacterium]